MKFYVSTEFKHAYLNRMIIVDGDKVRIIDPMNHTDAATTLHYVKESLKKLYVEIIADELINRYFFLRTQAPTNEH